MRIVGMVTNPPKITDLSKAEAELDKLEEHVKLLKRDFKDNFPDTVKGGPKSSNSDLQQGRNDGRDRASSNGDRGGRKWH